MENDFNEALKYARNWAHEQKIPMLMSDWLILKVFFLPQEIEMYRFAEQENDGYYKWAAIYALRTFCERHYPRYKNRCTVGGAFIPKEMRDKFNL